MSSFYGNGGYSSGGGGGSGEVISVNGKKGRVTLNAADVHALPEDTQIPSLEGFATEAWVNNQDFLTSEDISGKADISTTLSGYGITDAYTKTEVDGMIPENNLINIVDGSMSGSVRGIHTKKEDSSYKIGTNAWAEGLNTMAEGSNSHAEGNNTQATNISAHAEGGSTQAQGNYSHAEGQYTIASGEGSHVEGISTTASGTASHAEGYLTTARDVYSHAEGYQTTANGAMSHVEGYKTTAQGFYTHAEGMSTTVSGTASHAEGMSTTASGTASHAEGYQTIAQGYGQHVMGAFNVPQGSAGQNLGTDYVLIIGNGASDNSRSNALAIKWDGTFTFANNTEITPTQFTALLELLNTSGSNVSPDWNINDENEAGYIKNRPFYEDISDASVLYMNNNLVFNKNGAPGIIYASISGVLLSEHVQVGDILRVKIDENTYIAVVSESSGSLYAGGSNPGDSEVLSIGFGMQMQNVSETQTALSTIIFAGSDTSASHVVEISKLNVSYKLIDKKYLPADIVLAGTVATLFAKGNGEGAVIEGDLVNNTATGNYSHAEGTYAKAIAGNAHAEGGFTHATGNSSHAEGYSTSATGNYSHAEGGYTTAQGYMQHVMGEHNIPQGTKNSHTSSDCVFIVGNGTAQNPSNAFAMKWDGTFVFANGTEITPAQFTSLYNINNKIPLTGNETEGQVLTIDANGNPKWDNTSFVKVTDDGQGNVSMETLYGVLIDAAPAQNSNNLVTSGGIYTAINNAVGNIETLLAQI